MNAANLKLGCAGWAVPKSYRDHFLDEGSLLQRYASQFLSVEINSSFYRPHRPATYQRWADSVPTNFRFSAKIPKEITHVRRLSDVSEPLDKFLLEVTQLGTKLGPLLMQLPPSFAFDEQIVSAFFKQFRDKFDGEIVCEPRHVTWFTAEADDLLKNSRIGRVAADPAIIPTAFQPGGWQNIIYYRLHGSPRMYYSAYSQKQIDELAISLVNLLRHASAVWCIFDNTTLGEATGNALALKQRLVKI